MPTLAVIWRAAGLLLATSAESVVEVLPPLAWAPAPAVPDWVRGLFEYRGGLMPLVDANLLLGAAPEPDRMANRVLVIRAGGGDRPGWTVGLWVQRVLEPERIDFDAAGGHPGFATDAGRFLGPVARTRFGHVRLVRTQELFTTEQAGVLSRRLTGAVA